MSYDPNRTTVLPEIGFPITEELPAVVPGRGGDGPGGSGFLRIAAFLLIAAIIAIAAVLIIDNQRSSSDDIATDADPDPTPTAVAVVGNAAPTVVAVADTEPGFWRVTGVPDGLNVRSGPGTNNEIVGSLGANDRHIFGTGERANVNGAQWTQIVFGASDSVGWVSSQFLATDTPPDPDAPTPTPTPVPAPSGASVVCFESESEPNRVARLTISSGNLSGVILTIDGDTVIDQRVTGTLDNGSATVTLTTPATGASSQRTWTFRPADVDVGNGTVLSVVNCAAIAAQLPPG